MTDFKKLWLWNYIGLAKYHPSPEVQKFCKRALEQATKEEALHNENKTPEKL